METDSHLYTSESGLEGVTQRKPHSALGERTFIFRIKSDPKRAKSKGGKLSTLQKDTTVTPNNCKDAPCSWRF